jgi:hypothetical protein
VGGGNARPEQAFSLSQTQARESCNWLSQRALWASIITQSDIVQGKEGAISALNQ